MSEQPPPPPPPVPGAGAPPPPPPPDPTQLAMDRGIRAARRGQPEAARQHLSYVIQQQPTNELALMWMVQVAASPQEQWDYLNLITGQFPENQWAQQQLQLLQGGGAAAAPAATATTAPAPPAELFGEMRIRELKCPSCGGSCAIHGDEVKTVVCQFCQENLALSGDEMQILHGPRSSAGPSEPIKPGQECQFGSTRYMVIGWIKFRGWDAEESWTWEEWLLAGEDKSYAWLQKDEDGWQFYTRLPIKHKLNPRAARIPVPGGHADVIERAPAEIIAVQGALTWRAQVSDQLTYVDARKGGKTYSMEYTENEVELLAGSRLSEAEIWQAMGNDALVKALTNAKKARTGALAGCFLSFLVAGGLFLLLIIGIAGGLGGKSVLKNTATIQSGSTHVFGPFDMDSSRVHRLSIDITGLKPGDNVTSTVSILDANGESYGLNLSSSRSGNSVTLTSTFKPTPGNYRLQVQMPPSAPQTTVSASIKEGVLLVRYFFFAFLIAALLGVINMVRVATTTIRG